LEKVLEELMAMYLGVAVDVEDDGPAASAVVAASAD